ncbi:hypothetical protein ERL59_19395 [Chengkuizengella sp. YPA3-1-1]|uniref:LHH domain-containing protein n=2 Tax=Chengkuizengella marina TaxID=2507566 RepID=A0A6N9Q8U2_9BACL|nr:hypothetical protein [Chengkuizengella marina]
MNLYTYVHNNPLIYNDPSGHLTNAIMQKYGDELINDNSNNTYNPILFNLFNAVNFVYATPTDLHTTLDTIGLIPVVGEPADFVNGVWYTFEGDLANAGLSFSGMVPYAGWAATAFKLERKFWNMETIFNGKKVYQRDDLIDPNYVDEFGRTNLERMQLGRAPIGPDGKSINLHHTIQTDDGPIAEVTQSFHFDNFGTIHINPNTIPSGVDRKEFDKWKKQYWQNRALDFE